MVELLSDCKRLLLNDISFNTNPYNYTLRVTFRPLIGYVRYKTDPSGYTILGTESFSDDISLGSKEMGYINAARMYLQHIPFSEFVRSNNNGMMFVNDVFDKCLDEWTLRVADDAGDFL